MTFSWVCYLWWWWTDCSSSVFFQCCVAVFFILCIISIQLYSMFSFFLSFFNWFNISLIPCKIFCYGDWGNFPHSLLIYNCWGIFYMCVPRGTPVQHAFLLIQGTKCSVRYLHQARRQVKHRVLRIEPRAKHCLMHVWCRIPWPLRLTLMSAIVWRACPQRQMNCACK